MMIFKNKIFRIFLVLGLFWATLIIYGVHTPGKAYEEWAIEAAYKRAVIEGGGIILLGLGCSWALGFNKQKPPQ